MELVGLGVEARGSTSWKRVSVLGGQGEEQGLEMLKVHWEKKRKPKNIANWMLNLCPWPHRHR